MKTKGGNEGGSLERFVMFLILVLAVSALGIPNFINAQPKEITVAIVNPITGYTSPWGTKTTEGAKLAIEVINEQGGVRSLGGARLKANIYDTESKPEVAATVTERAIVRDGAVGIVGPSQSAAAYLASTIAEKHKIPIVFPDVIDPNIMKRGYKYTFRITANSIVWGKKIVEFISSLRDSKTGEKVKTVYLLYPNDASGKSFDEPFGRFVNEYGLELIGKSPYDPTIPDFSSYVTKMKHSNPDFVVSVGGVKDAARTIATFKELDFNPKGAYMMSGMYVEFIQLLGKDANYVFTSAEWSPYADLPGVEKGWGIKIANRYRERTVEKDIYMGNSGYDGYVSMMVLKDAIERAGSLDKEKIREAFVKTKLTPDRGGLTIEPIIFDEYGENINAFKSSTQIISEKIKVVFPPDGRELAPIYPIPRWENR